jgi:uncharacterized membrane protein YhaH (DUF805 family)
MSPVDYALMPLKRYADFSGRSRRSEYWFFILMNIVVYAVLGGLWAMMRNNALGSIFMGILVLYGLAMFIPSLACQIRRFHDQDKSGWFALLNFIPYLGGLIVLVFMFLEGTKGDNKFGPDPKAGG